MKAKNFVIEAPGLGYNGTEYNKVVKEEELMAKP